MRSWVDLLSNTVVLPTELIEDNLEDLLSAIIPPKFLTSFAHEFCHHWCFQSGVSAATALIYFQAVKQILRGGDDSLILAQDFILKYEAINQLLLPIMEGLSLFAEFDITIGSAPIASAPLSWTSLVALPELENIGTDHPYDIAARLMREPQYAGLRKETLLTTPCDLKKSPYLIGYLAIKATWMNRFASSEREEKDAFLMLVFTHLLNDYELIIALCSTEITVDEAVGKMSNRISTILTLLGDPLKTPLNSLWETTYPENYMPIKLPKLKEMNTQYYEKALAAIEDIFYDLMLEPEGDELRSLNSIFEIALYRRMFVTIGYTEIIVEYDKKNTVWLKTSEGYDVELFDTSWLNEKITLGNGVLEILLCPSLQCYILVLFQKDQVVGLRVIGVEGNNSISSFPINAITTQKSIKLSNFLKEIVTRIEINRNQYKEVFEDVSERLIETLEKPIIDLFGQFTISKLRQDGYWSICNKSLENLRSLAEISLLTDHVLSNEILSKCPEIPSLTIRNQKAILA